MDTVNCRATAALLSLDRRSGGSQTHANLAVASPGDRLFPKVATCYRLCMTDPAPLIEDDEETAEAQALAAAISESDADPRTAPHEEVRAWLLRIANGEFDAPPPEPH